MSSRRPACVAANSNLSAVGHFERDKMIPKIAKDPSRIQSAWGDDGETGATVGRDGVTRIEAYEENGQMAPVPWLAVFKSGRCVQRLNAAHMTDICYG